MAERRMFAKTIIDSDAFLDMPLSAQALYFHLSMRADDDGFVNNPKRIQRAVGGNDDDYKLLIAKHFILCFETGVIVIKHWKIHNYIRSDRKKDTNYPEEMSLLEEKENGSYTFKSDTALLEQKEVDKTNDYRKEAYARSSLPYSFDYKIRNAFTGKPCPVCGALMQGGVDECGITSDIRRPTIQHNIPLSKGGKHELGNISVICHQCNITIKDNETGSLNAEEVIQVWDCLSNDGHMSGKCQANVSIGKDRLGKDNKESSLHSDSSSVRKTDYDIIIALWNELDGLGNIKGIRSIGEGSKRRENVRARLKQYGIDGFRDAINNIKNSDFLQGKHYGKPWSITFDWFVLPTNFPKVLEGNYNNANTTTETANNNSDPFSCLQG